MSMNTINKRVLKDITEGKKNLKAEYGIHLEPEETNYYNVHFIVPGPEDTPYEGGLYHGMIRLNQSHPGGPPSVFMITPNGRFVPESYPFSPNSRGICTSFTSYHPETWSPIYNIETVLKSFISFMCDNDGAMGAIINTPDTKKKELAVNSLNHLLKEPLVQNLFPELCVELTNGTYKPTKISELGKNKIKSVESKEKVPEKKIVSSRSEKEIPKSKSKKKVIKKVVSSSESSEEIPKSKKKVIKKVVSSESEEEIPKSKRKSSKKVVSSSESEEEIPKSKRKSSKKVVSSSESEEEIPKSKSKKKSSKKVVSSSESEEDIPKSKSKKKSSKKVVSSSESEEDAPRSKKKSSKKSK